MVLPKASIEWPKKFDPLEVDTCHLVCNSKFISVYIAWETYMITGILLGIIWAQEHNFWNIEYGYDGCQFKIYIL